MGAAQQELYAVLGLCSGAGREEVRRAYKQLAARLHPDKHAPGTSQADRAAAEERFKAVSAAYQALMG
jgi:DnaJ-class molecular chaperone